LMSIEQWGGAAACVLIIAACVYAIHRLAQSSVAITDEDREAWPGSSPEKSVSKTQAPACVLESQTSAQREDAERRSDGVVARQIRM
jgi:hypothetical protein